MPWQSYLQITRCNFLCSPLSDSQRSQHPSQQQTKTSTTQQGEQYHYWIRGNDINTLPPNRYLLLPEHHQLPDLAMGINLHRTNSDSIGIFNNYRLRAKCQSLPQNMILLTQDKSITGNLLLAFIGRRGNNQRNIGWKSLIWLNINKRSVGQRPLKIISVAFKNG